MSLPADKNSMELKNLTTEADKLRLTPAEKTAMKARIFGLPAGIAHTPAQSPYFIFSFQFMQARVLAPLAVLLVVFASAGTAAAAQGALPGDVLYPVKLSVNEAVEVALATTPVARAQVQAKQAVRRVEEAEVLAAQGELTPDTSAELAANFETHVQAAQALTDDVAQVDPDTGASLAADLGSSLAVHSAILATLGQDSAAADDHASGSESLATRVLARADEGRAVAAAKVMTLSVVAPQAKMQPMAFSAKLVVENASTTQNASTTTDTDTVAPVDGAQEKVVGKLKARAQSAVVYVRANFNDTKDDLDATTSAQVTAKLAEIDQLMVDGNSALEAHEYADATADFTQALGSSIKLSTLLIVQQKIQRNIVTPVLENHLIINTDDDASDPIVGGVRMLPATGL